MARTHEGVLAAGIGEARLRARDRALRELPRWV